MAVFFIFKFLRYADNYIYMRELIRKKFFNFIQDKYCWISCIFSTAILFCHVYLLFNTDTFIEPLIRICYCLIYPFVIFFLGREAIIFLFLFFGLTIEQFTDFTNFTAFFILIFFLLLHKKYEIPVLIVYAADVIIVCANHDKSCIHLVTHLLNCAFIYFASGIIFKLCLEKLRISIRKLDLDETDRYILSELSKGAHQKEIDGYSENTVSKRLKKMRERNFCSTNHELLMLFIAEIQ